MQLKALGALPRLNPVQIASVCLVASSLMTAVSAHAQDVDVETTHTIYHEAPSRSKMTVYTPGLALAARPAGWLHVSGGYEADVVSGASVSVKAGAAYQAVNAGADVVSAASVHDLRHRATFGAGVQKDDVTFDMAALYSTENDYRSKTLTFGIRTEAYEHNTQFELNYAKSLDDVCDRVQSSADAFPRFRALENSTGCFTNDALRRTRDVNTDGLQGTWSQAWTSTFLTQLVYSAQIVSGFQSNPYRSVVVGQGLKGQEHEPDNRARHSLAARGNYYVKPLHLVFRIGARAYVDSWGIKSGTVELEAERQFGERVRFALRGRAYRQTGALFWSDDYTGGNTPLGPRGQYFTGDRELSPFWSGLVGARVTYTDVKKKRRVLGAFQTLRMSLSFDVLQFSYDEFTLGGVPITNARAFIGTGSILLGF